MNLISSSLKLDWKVATSVSVTQAETIAPLVTPPAEEMEILYNLAMEGNMRKIIQWAEAMAANDARYQPFMHRLEHLARQYESHAILKLVEAHVALPASSS